MAADWDAVHVCVAGYLTTAGIAIPVGDGASTMLAGWDPDATWWLTDVLSLAGAPQDWRADRQAPLGWAQAEPVAGTRLAQRHPAQRGQQRQARHQPGDLITDQTAVQAAQPSGAGRQPPA